MYAIGYVIYGVPFTADFQDNLENGNLKLSDFQKLADTYDLDDIGDVRDVVQEGFCETVYRGSGKHTAGWIGTRIGEFDECSDGMPMSDLINMQPTPTQKQEAEDKLKETPQEVLLHLPPVGIYIVWGSS